MAEPSQVYQAFQRGKLAAYQDSLEGVGPKGIELFKEKGINNAIQIMGMYLLENRDEARFKEWLTDVIGLRPRDVDGMGGKPGLMDAIKMKADQILGI